MKVSQTEHISQPWWIFAMYSSISNICRGWVRSMMSLVMRTTCWLIFCCKCLNLNTDLGPFACNFCHITNLLTWNLAASADTVMYFDVLLIVNYYTMFQMSTCDCHPHLSMDWWQHTELHGSAYHTLNDIAPPDSLISSSSTPTLSSLLWSR